MGKTVSSSFLVLLSTIKSKAYFVLYRSIKSEVDLTLFCMMWPCKHLYAVWGWGGGYAHINHIYLRRSIV